MVFRSLAVEEIRQIVELLLARVRDQLRAQQIDLIVTQEAKDHIIKLGYDADGRCPTAAARHPEHGRGVRWRRRSCIGRFKGVDAVVVDVRRYAGLIIEPVTEKTPVEAV